MREIWDNPSNWLTTLLKCLVTIEQTDILGLNLQGIRIINKPIVKLVILVTCRYLHSQKCKWELPTWRGCKYVIRETFDMEYLVGKSNGTVNWVLNKLGNIGSQFLTAK